MPEGPRTGQEAAESVSDSQQTLTQAAASVLSEATGALDALDGDSSGDDEGRELVNDDLSPRPNSTLRMSASHLLPALQRTEEGDDAERLDAETASKYRARAARANDLAGDRTDTMYSVKEICRYMAHPTLGAWITHGKAMQKQQQACQYFDWNTMHSEFA